MNDETQNNELPDNETQNGSPKDTKKKIMAVAIQTMIIVILIAGGIWLVCRKSWQGNTEKNVPEDTIDDITENTEASVDSEEENSADTEEEEPEVTVISVLGKEELVIENDRIQESDLKMIDNMFTLEEINTILSAIKGTWEVDRAMGMISYDDYQELYLPEVTREEGVRQYYENIELMPHPDFTISIKERSTSEGGIVDAEDNYIYVRTKDGVNYDSPMSIVLSVGPFVSLQRDFEEESPSIYIQFFSICDSEMEGDHEAVPYAADGIIPYMCQEKSGRSYEPATLILTPEGEFMLYKDGVFYSLKQTIQSELMSGNFEHLDGTYDEDVTYSDYMTKWYSRQQEAHEWRQLDLNGDGIEDLILQESREVGEWGHHEIVAIFACEKDSASCIFLDMNDMSEYYFCGPAGELMYTASSYGLWVAVEPYDHYYYDREWNRIKDYSLVVYDIDVERGLEEYPQQVEEWKQNHPDMAEQGVYFRKETDAGEEALTQEEFTEIYETVTGLGFYSSFFTEKTGDRVQ